MTKLEFEKSYEDYQGGIIYIPLTRLEPHPDNPRKSLGDLDELTASIAQNGILQNLTVVPMIGNISGTWDGESYRVIIGHRRLAAAKLAGVTELPCVVTEMTQSEQIMTMLMENMQRADLTVYEQAQSFQMMLDLGETVESIAENSGFSTSTVRRRVKLLELDPEGFKKSEARGATLSDYMELDKLTDPERKNVALAAIGTANFANVLKKEQDEEKFVEYMGRQKTAVESFATRIEKGHEINGEAVPMAYILGCNRWSQREVEVPEDTDTGTYYYTINDTATEIALYKRTEPAAEDGAAAIETEEQRQRRERREANDRRTKQIKEIGQRHFALRIEFVRSFSAVKKHLPTILHMAADAVIGNGSWRDSVDQNILEAILDEELPEDAEELELKEALDESMSIRPEKTLLAVAYSKLDSEHRNYYGTDWTNGMYQCRYEQDDELDRLYQHLTALGYQMSDEEKAMQNGTHELLKDEPDTEPEQEGESDE